MTHSFNVEIAKKYGMPCAVILEYIRFWISKNEADGRNYYDGYFWTYASLRELAERFPYLTWDQVRRSIEKLRNDGVITSGNFNKRGFDRTLWYTITRKGWELFSDDGSHLASTPNAVGNSATSNWQESQMDMASLPDAMASTPNAVGNSARPIPVIIPSYSNPVIDTVINQKEQRAREEDSVDPNWMRFSDAYKQNLGPFEYDKPMVLDELTSLYESMGVEVMLEAIKVTALKHTDNPRQYFMKLCRRWDEKGINTLEKAKVEQQEHDRRQKGGTNSGEHRSSSSAAPRRIAGETIV